MSRKILLVAVLVIATGASATRAAEGAVKLEFKPTEAPVEYWIRNVDSTAEYTSTSSTPGKHIYDTLERVEMTARVNPVGQIEVQANGSQKTVQVDGKEFPADLPGKKITYTISRQGQHADGVGADDLEAKLSPVFPAGPIAPGHSWTVEIKPSRKLPVPLTVKHTFVKVEKAQGTSCAVIETTGEARGRDPQDGFGFAVKVKGTTQLGIDEGVLVRSETTTIIAAKGTKPATAGIPMFKQEVRRVVQRRSAFQLSPPLIPYPAW